MGTYLAPAPAVALELRHNLNYDGDRDEQRTRRSADCLGGHRSAGADVPIERTETGAHSFRGADLFSSGAGGCCSRNEGSSAGPLAESAIARCLTSAAFNCSLVRIPASISAPFKAPISTLISLISRSPQSGLPPTGRRPLIAPGSFGSKGRHWISGSTSGPLLLGGRVFLREDVGLYWHGLNPDKNAFIQALVSGSHTLGEDTPNASASIADACDGRVRDVQSSRRTSGATLSLYVLVPVGARCHV